MRCSARLPAQLSTLKPSHDIVGYSSAKAGFIAQKKASKPFAHTPLPLPCAPTGTELPTNG
jgi:hypothetical protein